MAKKGVKIKDLAKELDVTSRVLIDRCRANGMPVQNSITKIDDRAADSVRSWFANDSATSDEQTNG
ncbi:MAG: translation initiation factor IF-2 N-terminal domain-containing protein [Planctomycetes bacterium]|nr:translation initiation factor IF-2 N-terminal domain-containing protein [Planctomycetota bacterium]